MMTAAGRTGKSLAGAAWLTDGGLPRLLAALDGNGEEIRVVGGAVRNALLGEPFSEVDLATTAVPDEVNRRARAAGFKTVPTGIEHGTVTVIVDGVPFEVTTLRQDVETFGRHATVAFGRDWKADAERRDFTINALSITRDGAVYDYVGGLDDLAVRRVRFIGEAKRRIEEDYLRILRFFRFHAAYGRGVLDPDGIHACIAGRDGLLSLSRERVRMEFVKLLVAPGAAPVLQVMADAGFILLTLNTVPNVVEFSAMRANERALGLPADAIRGLAALCVLVAEDADRLHDKLRLSKAEHARLLAMANDWRRLAPSLAESGRRAALYRSGAGTFVDQALLAWARAGGSDRDPGWRALATLPQQWTAPPFPIGSADLIARGVAKGPTLGAALKYAEAEWIAAGFPLDKAALSALADRAARSVTSA